MNTIRKGRIFYTDSEDFLSILQSLGYQWNGTDYVSISEGSIPIEMHRVIYHPRMDALAQAYQDKVLNIPHTK